jgi:hypothetical protein
LNGQVIALLYVFVGKAHDLQRGAFFPVESQEITLLRLYRTGRKASGVYWA